MLNRRSFTLGAAVAPFAACQQPDANSDDLVVSHPDARWRDAPHAPYAVQEIYPAVHNNAIWVAGGFAPLAALGATQRVIVFDFARNAWTNGPALPAPSHHVHLASLNGELWAIGGFLGGDNRRRWICTPRVLKLQGDAWIAGLDLPKPIGEAMPIVHLGRIHLIGGRSPNGAANAEWQDHGDVGEHFVIGAGETAWSRAEALPMARNSAAGVSDGDRLHVVSGRTVANGQTPRHDIYDPRTGQWSEGHAFPEPRGGLAGAFWRGTVIAGGGEIFEPGSVGAQLYRYDPAQGWLQGPAMPTPRHGHGLVSHENALYALGGARSPSGRNTLSSMDVLA
jgi:hypothetical protein